MPFSLSFATAALAAAAAFTPLAPQVPTTPQATLPSGSSEEFQRRMLDWVAPNAPKPLVATNTVDEIRGVRLDRLAISSPFGWRIDPIDGIRRLHAGIDLPGRAGSPVRATGPGVVEIAGWVPGYGNMVEIEHPGGVRSRYGHLSRVRVRTSQHVEQGQLIGDVGSTGHSTGPHLHYEVRVKGVSVDPLRLVIRTGEPSQRSVGH